MEKETLTIKKVLDLFIESGPVCRDLICWRTEFHGLCPLQAATGCRNGYELEAKLAGLTARDVYDIIAWADTGHWPIPEVMGEVGGQVNVQK